MAGAMIISFGVLFVVESITDPPSADEILHKILMVPLRAFGAWLGGVGAATLAFIVLSRSLRDPTVDLDEPWTPDDLADIPTEPHRERRAEAFLSIAVLTLLIVLLNVYPGVVTAAEDLFGRTGIALGHRLVVPVFRRYVFVLTAIWIGEVITHILMLRGRQTLPRIGLAETAFSAAEAILAALMLADADLHTDSSGWIGFKVIFIILLVVNVAEVGWGLFRMVRNRIVSGSGQNRQSQ
jgi:hypothetical protein